MRTGTADIQRCINIMSGNRVLAAVVSLMAIAVVSIIVLVAIGADRLWSLIGGVGVIGAIAVVLSAIGVALYARMSASRAQREELLYHHAETMAKCGLMVSDRRALSYEPMQTVQRLADPEAEKRKRLAQVNFASNDPITLSVNLVLYSMIENGNDSNRICGIPIPGCSGRAWQMAVDYMKEHYQVVSTRGAGGGTYVPESIGTLKALYGVMSVNALPGTEK